MKTFLLSFFFVLLYGSGFVATKIGLTYADPYSFLATRFFLTCIILTLVSIVFKLQWPNTFKDLIHTAISGLLIIGVFSIGVFSSIAMGLPAATSSLIISLNPMLVSLLVCFLFQHRISSKQWTLLIIGLTGVFFILMHKINTGSATAIGMSLVGLLGLALGSIYQKRFCAQMNIFTGGVIHTATSGLFCLLLLTITPHTHISWNSDFLAALLWMSVAVSIGALSLLYLLIRQHAIDRVASLFYLMPVSSVILSALLLKENISNSEIIGIIITSLAVFLVNLLSENKAPNKVLTTKA